MILNRKDVLIYSWSDRSFRKKVTIAILLNVAMLITMPFFFQYIEHRIGIQLNDPLLQYIRPVDVSIPVFVIIWSMTGLIILRAIQNPEICITFLFAFLILCISRIITISIFALAPPAGLIPLTDPLTNIVYGNSFVTKDLFYSGHAGTQFLMFLCLKKRTDKVFTVISTFTVGVLLLLQHVHYTIDIVAAPIFAYLCFVLARKMLRYRYTHNQRLSNS